MEAATATKLVLAFIIFVTGLTGGCLPRLLSSRFLHLSEGGAAGIFLSAGFIHLLPEANNDYNEWMEGIEEPYPWPFLIACLGFVVTLSLEYIVKLRMQAGARREGRAEGRELETISFLKRKKKRKTKRVSPDGSGRGGMVVVRRVELADSSKDEHHSSSSSEFDLSGDEQRSGDELLRQGGGGEEKEAGEEEEKGGKEKGAGRGGRNPTLNRRTGLLLIGSFSLMTPLGILLGTFAFSGSLFTQFIMGGFGAGMFIAVGAQQTRSMLDGLLREAGGVKGGHGAEKHEHGVLPVGQGDFIKSLVLFFLLASHSIIAGITLGVQGLSGALVTATAILIHKGVASFALGVSIWKASKSAGDRGRKSSSDAAGGAVAQLALACTGFCLMSAIALWA